MTKYYLPWETRFSNKTMNVSGNPGSIYFFKFNNVNTRTMCEICSKLAVITLKTPARHQ